VGAVATRADACGCRCEEADIIEASRSGLSLCVMSAISPVGGPFNSRYSFGQILNTNALPLYHMRQHTCGYEFYNTLAEFTELLYIFRSLAFYANNCNIFPNVRH
jgi:hypothetical protein